MSFPARVTLSPGRASFLEAMSQHLASQDAAISLLGINLRQLPRLERSIGLIDLNPVHGSLLNQPYGPAVCHEFSQPPLVSLHCPRQPKDAKPGGERSDSGRTGWRMASRPFHLPDDDFKKNTIWKDTVPLAGCAPTGDPLVSNARPPALRQGPPKPAAAEAVFFRQWIVGHALLHWGVL
ncbi:hypothetical protein BN1708_005131 [Verticillium longisporum]|uniref:Uncharacterized protein n=1 Tax=Verticillium longisporum TaxID=100787 RepID=A0A0G4M717_VERLO|nr:hypothetical protein BN1708_005131 [Verticillium longisporum]